MLNNTYWKKLRFRYYIKILSPLHKRLQELNNVLSGRHADRTKKPCQTYQVYKETEAATWEAKGIYKELLRREFIAPKDC